MKKKMYLLSATMMLLVALSMVPRTGTALPFPPLFSDSRAGEITTTTVTVTITAINLGTNTVTLKDQSGKIYVFVVDPLKIDLRKYKAGQTVTATISTTVTTDKVTRARISKQQLIKLQ